MNDLVYPIVRLDASISGVTLLGVFSSAEKAKQYVDKVERLPGQDYAILVFKIDALGLPVRMGTEDTTVVQFPDCMRIIPDVDLGE